MEVGEAYSTAIEQILQHPELRQWEYILTLEHDNCPPSDGVLKLLERMEERPEYSCIGGLYFTKGEGGVAQIWGDVKDPVTNYRPQLPDPKGGLVECYGTGMGFNLFRFSMFNDHNLQTPLVQDAKGRWHRYARPLRLERFQKVGLSGGDRLFRQGRTLGPTNGDMLVNGQGETKGRRATEAKA
jgi:hypothetical protein